MATCRFLRALTFRSLLGAITEEEFRSRYWEQRPLVVHRSDPDYYDDLFTLRDFDDAITRSPTYIKVNDATTTGTTVKSANAGGLEAILADMRAGGTLILEQLQRHEPKLGQFCRLLGQELGHSFETNLYLTPPYGKSSVPHWDNTDVFSLQLLGSKHWRIEKERRVFPIRPHKMGDDARQFTGDCDEFTVDQGDLIYIPRGFMHVAECGAEPSLHISVGLVPVVLEELLHAIINAAVQGDEGLRVALPLGFMNRGGEAVVRDAAALLRAVADESFVSAVFDRFRDELVQQSPLDISGQITDFFHPAALGIDDTVAPRPGVVYRLHADDDNVRINVGTRSIVFAGHFRRTLDFALSTPSFAVRDVEGDLDDEERLAFVTRLIEEGLIVRTRS